MSKLLDEAQAGRVTGIAFVAIKAEGFVADACGEAYNDPATTLGMVAVLEAKLARRAKLRASK
jgi:hypothetical protein